MITCEKIRRSLKKKIARISDHLTPLLSLVACYNINTQMVHTEWIDVGDELSRSKKQKKKFLAGAVSFAYGYHIESATVCSSKANRITNKFKAIIIF